MGEGSINDLREVYGRLLEALDPGLEGFEVHELHVVAEGICAECAGQNSGREES